MILEMAKEKLCILYCAMIPAVVTVLFSLLIKRCSLWAYIKTNLTFVSTVKYFLRGVLRVMQQLFPVFMLKIIFPLVVF